MHRGQVATCPPAEAACPHHGALSSSKKEGRPGPGCGVADRRPWLSETSRHRAKPGGPQGPGPCRPAQEVQKRPGAGRGGSEWTGRGASRQPPGEAGLVVRGALPGHRHRHGHRHRQAGTEHLGVGRRGRPLSGCGGPGSGGLSLLLLACAALSPLGCAVLCQRSAGVQGGDAPGPGVEQLGSRTLCLLGESSACRRGSAAQGHWVHLHRG